MPIESHSLSDGPVVSLPPHSKSKAGYSHLLLLLKLLAILVFFISSVESHGNQQLIIDFDDDQTPPTNSIHSTPSGSSGQSVGKPDDRDPSFNPEKSDSKNQRVPPAPVPVPTGLVATLIKRITGWNDTVVAKLTGQISPRAPHPFVVAIDDDNYEHVIESDLDLIRPGWGCDEKTVWVISVVATDRSSILFDEEFDKLASNSSLAVNPIPSKKREDEIDLVQKEPSDPYLFNPKIRFGRIDYMGKTDFILTKWLIFKCPVLVVITNRGNDLRFFKTGAVPPTADHLGDFLRNERWLMKPTWNSTFSKGNNGEWVVTSAARIFQGFHLMTDRVPGWLLMILSSMVGTSLMQWLHKPKPKPNNQTKKTQSSRQPTSSSSPSSLKKTSTQSAADSSVHLSQSDLASQELKRNLADAAVQLINATDQKIGHGKPQAQDQSSESNEVLNTRSVRKRKN